jgi:beta-glucuronidase
MNIWVGMARTVPGIAIIIRVLANERPLIDSAFGGGAPFGNQGDADARWTEQYQANLYEQQSGMLKRIPSWAGISPRVLMGFHSPRRLVPGVQDCRNRKASSPTRGNARKLSKFCRSFIAT